MPKVALVYPYFRTRNRSELLFAPLGVATLSGQLKSMGIETRVFDCTFSSFAQLQKSLLSYQPEIIGISCMVTLSRNTFKIAKWIRANLGGSLLVAGGALPTLYPERFSQSFDLVFRGEADLSFARICADYLSQSDASRRNLTALPLDHYGGLFVRRGDLQIDNPMVHASEAELDSFPLPDRGDFDHGAYQAAGLTRDGSKTTSIITTYGCPFECDFCSKPVFGNLFRRRNLNRVFAEITQIRELGYDSLWIADDNFTLDLKYLREFCGRMKKSPIRWTCLSRVSGITPEIAGLMKSAGCSRVYLGLESGSQATLGLMNKKATVVEAMRAISVFRDAGIEVGAFFIVGYPGETIESIESTFRFALEQPLNEISFNVPFPLPGSKLFERVSGQDTARDWDQENEVTFVYQSEFDEAWLRTRIDKALKDFAEKSSGRLR